MQGLPKVGHSELSSLFGRQSLVTADGGLLLFLLQQNDKVQILYGVEWDKTKKRLVEGDRPFSHPSLNSDDRETERR